MQKFILSFRSYTSAMKAHSILEQNGINSSIGKKADTSEGCMYTLNIDQDHDRAVQILNKNGISYTQGNCRGVRR